MAAQKKSMFETVSGKKKLNYAYSIGAAVVIAGALFKIMHWKGANEMLILGMSTEVLIFIISAFEPQYVEKHYNWENVYPQLLTESAVAPVAGSKNAGLSPTQQLDDMLEKAKIGPELIESLGKGLSNLSTNVAKMSDLSDVSVATNDFAANAKAASQHVGSFANAAAAATQSLSNIEAVSGVLTASANEAVVLKDKLADLNKNLAALNTVYGNILTAMRPQ